MSEQLTRPRIIDIVRREWWLVALTVAAAVVVAFIVSSSGEDTYIGRSAVVIDSYNISRFKGIPTPDEIINEGEDSLAPRLADAAGTTEATIKDAVSLAVVGSPPRRLVVTYRAAEEQAAREGALAVARAISDYSTERAGVEINRQTTIIQSTERALELIGEPTAENAYERNALMTQKVDAETNLAILSTIYTAEGEPSVTHESAEADRRDALIAGVFLGLVLGVVLAVAREAFMRYRSER